MLRKIIAATSIILLFNLAFASPIFCQNKKVSDAEKYKSRIAKRGTGGKPIIVKLKDKTKLKGVIAFRRKNEELCLYENGLTYSNGEITQTVKWDEIHSVYEFAFRTVVTYSITTKDDQDLIFEGHFKNIKQIGERLKYEAEIRNLPIIWGVASDYRSNLLSVIPK